MATEERRRRVAVNRASVRAEQKDLTNEQDQAAILEPPADTVDLGAQPTKLYPLSGYTVRKLAAIAQQVFASAQGTGPLALRVSGVLAEQYVERFLPLLAEATARPGTLSAEQLVAIAREIDERTANARGSIDLANAFATMLTQNGVLEVFSPKN